MQVVDEKPRHRCHGIAPAHADDESALTPFVGERKQTQTEGQRKRGSDFQGYDRYTQSSRDISAGRIERRNLDPVAQRRTCQCRCPAQRRLHEAASQDFNVIVCERFGDATFSRLHSG